MSCIAIGILDKKQVLNAVFPGHWGKHDYGLTNFITNEIANKILLIH